MHNLNLNSILKDSNYHRPLLFNGGLWSLAFVILLFIFSRGQSPISVDYIYTTIFLLFLAIPVSINFYILIPKFLKQEKYLFYAMSFIINLVVFMIFSHLCLVWLLDQLFPNYFFISYVSYHNTILTYSIVLVATSLLKLTEDWFYFNTNERRLLKHRNQQIETQLTALRAQINPHFLFNSLNVIYALALEQKEGITKAIVQLSDVLRYVIYDSDTEYVTLKDEIKLLQNYIAFQNHRLDNPKAVDVDVKVNNDNFKIYPMLLLPLLENSYKYGIIPGEVADTIKIKLYQDADKFQFTISNANLDTKNRIEDKHSGVGIENIKNNLNLVYPNSHKFEVESTKETFKVFLEINNVFK